MRVKPFAYVSKAEYGSGEELESKSGHFIQVTGITRNLFRKPVVLGRLKNYDPRLNQKTDTPREVSLIISSLVPKEDSREVVIKVDYGPEDLTIEGIVGDNNDEN